ncbi:CBS domain-containing protein [Sandaracinobacteroides hominis]|uniref:CBS domain-containing protein n=1 Tax=Sandaracinobacteroides hominis TaxID=2780086 RepID=UPI0018F55795|nr:CBS domain-containing protein [Sandaracinobacteroides hominis]
MGISSILRTKGSEVASVAPDSSVTDIVGELTTRRIGAVLVIDSDSVVGVVSERDVIRGLGGHQGEVLNLTARDIMTAPVITISPQDSIADAMELMTDRRIRHLPVVDSGVLVGLVSIGDLVKRRIEEAEQEALALKDYIATG